MKQIRNTGLLIILLLLSACGYHLRSGLDLPEEYKFIYIQGASSQLRSILKRDLRFTGVKLTNSVNEADIVIHVVNENFRRNVLSLSSSGRANEYELNYILDFQLVDGEGQTISETQSIDITQDYFNNQDDLLGKNIEERVIRDEIYRQAVKSMLNRSRLILKK